uniref:PD-(D/E)XK nuclease-like domain-containing protein n=1 Tax=Streptococcus pluranimalium TaxID=82348 RepID=UPI003F691E56
MGAFKELPVLTEENYYDDTEYMSTSRFKGFMTCEARQQAIEYGFWKEPSNGNFTVGNYIHSYFESAEAHEKFVRDNEDKIISKSGKSKGQPKADFKQADKMIKTLESQELFNVLYHGLADDVVEKEVIVTGVLEGIPFKGKIDSLNLSKGYFADIKTMQSIQKGIFSPKLGYYTNQITYNIFEFSYDLQMYVYSRLLEQTYGEWFTPYIVAVSKESVPDKEIIIIDDDILRSGRETFEHYAPRLRQILNDTTDLHNCGCCDFCLTYKNLTTAKLLSDI